MLPFMPIERPTREYVIERGVTNEGQGIYVAYWCDPYGTASFAQRFVTGLPTVTDVQELMSRHYPGAVCMYIPEDCAALITAAIEATKGGSG